MFIIENPEGKKAVFLEFKYWRSTIVNKNTPKSNIRGEIKGSRFNFFP